MEKTNWKEIVEDFTALLRLNYPPVAMKWIKTEEELMPEEVLLADGSVLEDDITSEDTDNTEDTAKLIFNGFVEVPEKSMEDLDSSIYF